MRGKVKIRKGEIKIMQAKYSRKFFVNASNCDFTGCQSVDNIFDLFMDTSGEHATELKINADDLKKDGLFWIIAKTMVRFYERPRLYDLVTVSTWPEAGAGYRCFRSNTIEKDGEILVACRQQWAVISAADGKARNVADILPADLIYLDERAVDEDFYHITGDFPNEPFAAYKVRSTDIDFVGHMNNVAYIRALETIYTTKQWRELDPYEIEISYAASCHEGDELLFTKRENSGKTEILAYLEGGKKIAYYTLTPRR